MEPGTTTCMKISEASPELRQEQCAYINTRWKDLYTVQGAAAKAAQQYLFLTNAGGAAATLAFIGAVGASKIAVGAKVSLIFFVMGLIFVGISRAKEFHRIMRVFAEWQSLANAYFKNEMAYESIIEIDKRTAVETFWDYFFPYAAFICFIAGAIFGLLALFFS